jgi:predicted RNA-binding protein YlqC (UPF0109 family)
MEDFVRTIVQALVDHPDQVSISSKSGKHISVIELRVAKVDLGKVIGRHGRNIESLRILLKAASGKMGKRAVLELIESL